MRSPVADFAARTEALARRRPVQIVLVLLVALYAAHQVTRSMGDFKVYHRAAKRAVAGESVYRLSDPHRYLYAPVVTFLFFPLAVVPAVVGRALWLALNVAALVSVFRTTAELLFPEGRAPPGFYALLLLLSLRFIDNNLGHGQINIVLLWLILQAYAMAAKGRHARAGLELAAAIAAKIVPAVLLIQILLRRQWRFASWTALGMLVLMAVPVLWWGNGYPQLLRDWTAVLADQAGHYEMGNKINQSISAFVYRLFRPHPGGVPIVTLSEGAVAALTLAVHGALLVPLVRLSSRLAKSSAEPPPQGPRGDELSLYLLYSTVAAPYSWKYYFANLVFPLGGAAGRLWEADHRRAEIGLAIAFTLNLLAGLELLGKSLSTTFQLWSFHFLAVVVLFALLSRAARTSFTNSSGVC